MLRIVNLLLVIVFVGLPQIIYSQWRTPFLEKFGPDDGLTGEVRDIVQDPFGFIYLASDQGIYQYNGKDFKLYLHNPEDSTSISPGLVYRIFVSSDSLVWLAIYNSGINSFNPKTGKFRHYPFPAIDKSDKTGAFSIGEDQKGNIWAGAYYGRLYKLNPKTAKFTMFLIPGTEESATETHRINIRNITPSIHDPEIFYLSVYGMAHPELSYQSQGLIRFNTRDYNFSWIPCNLYLNYQDQSGLLWGSTWGSNIVRYSPETEACDWFTFQELYGDYPKPFGGPKSTDIIRYHNQLLIANLGLLEFNDEEKINFYIKGELDLEYSSLYVDKDQNLWIGHSQGVMVLAPKFQNIRFYSLSEFGIDTRLYPGRISYHPDSRSIILGFHVYNNPNRLFSIPLDNDQGSKIIYKIVPESISGTAVGPSGRIYYQSDNKIYETDPLLKDIHEIRFQGTENFAAPWVWYMSAHPEGWICGLGTESFFWFHEDNRSVKSVFLQDLIPENDNHIFEGFNFISKQRALLHSTQDLHLINLANGEFTRIKFGAKLKKEIEYITCAKEGLDGHIWLSTHSTLFKTSLEGDSLNVIRTYTTNDGIISPTIKELQIDRSGRIWLYTNSGMDGFDVEKNEIRHFGLREGLEDIFIDPVQVLELPDGRIANVNGNGIIVFHPDSLWHAFDPEDATVVIQDLRINGRPLKQDLLTNFSEKVELPLSSKVVDLTFNALTFPNNSKTSYSYRLNGGSEEWIGIGNNNFLTLPDIPYGNTSLEIKAGPPEYNVLAKRLIFFKPTPLYARAWFMPSLTLLAVSGIFSIAFLRLRQIQLATKKEIEVNRQLAELELKALRSQMNPHFMFNSLNSIKTYVLEAKPEIAADYLSQFAHLIRKILQNSREKKISLREEIDTLLLYISLERFRFDNAFSFEHELGSSIPSNDIYIPPMLLQPFIENAIWHGLMHKGKGGILKLIFQVEGDNLICIVDDNGVGRKKAAELKSLSARKHKSMGLGITQSRIELLNTLNIFGISLETVDKVSDSGEALGTRVILKIPLEFDED